MIGTPAAVTFEVGATSPGGRAGMLSDRRVGSPATGSVLLLLDGYRDVAVSRDAGAAKVSDERQKGQTASRCRCETRALAAGAVFAFGPQIGKEARRFTGVSGLDIKITTITTASK